MSDSSAAPERDESPKTEATRSASAGLPASVGRFQILAQLGAGGFGVVYKGYDPDLRRAVAVKVPHRERLAAPEDAEAYLAEACTPALPGSGRPEATGQQSPPRTIGPACPGTGRSSARGPGSHGLGGRRAVRPR
jgi:hypothetical protein